MQGSLTFLGTGTSMGVPTLGCACAVCHSADPHDRRLRPSVLLRWQEDQTERTVVIDTGPDFREQALRHQITGIDAVFYTHEHADHILGMDDLRPLSFKAARRGDGPIPLFADADTTETLERVFDYTFSPDSTYPNRARVRLTPLEACNRVHALEFVRIPIQHGNLEISGFRVGKMAYLTDVSNIPEASFPLLEGLDLLVLSGLRHKPHHTHATLKQAVAWARRTGARQTLFTHISHDLAHQATNAELPDGMALAHDGLVVPVDLAPPALIAEARP